MRFLKRLMEIKEDQWDMELIQGRTLNRIEDTLEEILKELKGRKDGKSNDR